MGDNSSQCTAEVASKAAVAAQENLNTHIQKHTYNRGQAAGQPPNCPTNTPSALQKHILFWDRDADNIIHPHDVYAGFRDLGFSKPFSILSLLIPIFFSYPTRLGHSLIPDPFFRIFVQDIHKAKHGSDTGIYDLDGGFREAVFEEVFARVDGDGVGGLTADDLWRLVARDRVAADVAGWTFAAMEWGTTWLLLQREGRVWKGDLRSVYDGSLFWRIREEEISGQGWRQGFGWKEAWRLAVEMPSIIIEVSVLVALLAAMIVLVVWLYRG